MAFLINVNKIKTKIFNALSWHQQNLKWVTQ